MNDLCYEIGYRSVNHDGEQLCGDHIEVVETNDNSSVVVLADGLGSGVKASILSTLTSKIISTLISEGLSIEDCVRTIATTLPVCSVRGVAYSTFSILHFENNERVEIIQYDNPTVLLLREGQNVEYDKTLLQIEGKKIYRSTIPLREDDVIVAMSDGCPHAGTGLVYNFGWKLDNIAEFLAPLAYAGYSAKNLATVLIDEVNRLYGGKPGDDATVCVARIRKRCPVNIMFGPSSDKNDSMRMASLFFSKAGKHIVCGGTTSTIVSKYLNKPIKASLVFEKSDVPPIAEIEGVDLVTEGVITINKVLEYAKDYIADNKLYDQWNVQHDGAALISRMLFEEATDISFYVGRAINPAHQNPNLPINFNIKMNLVEELTKCLTRMGKRVTVSYF